MSFAVAISFPAGRFHATPWGRHVNDGLPEWPPSPWRLLRGMVAAWKRKLSDVEIVNEKLEKVLAKLAQGAPVFKLPPVSLGHTRHYMPWDKKGPGDKTLVFDAFVAIKPDAEIIIGWLKVELDAQEEQAARIVLSQMNYFGRAESWCSIRICPEWESVPGRICRAIDEDSAEMLVEAEPIRVLVPDPRMWKEWGYGKQSACPNPPWNLLAETADLHKEGWSDPPGSRWVTYLRPSDSFAVTPIAKRKKQMLTINAARFALDGPVLPMLTETVYVAEIARKYLQGIFGKHFAGATSATLSGKSEDGTPLSGHSHAFFLPTDEDGDGRLDHLTIFTRDGFDLGREMKAIDCFRHMHGPGGGPDINVVLTAYGLLEDMKAIPVLSQSSKWRSVTPFIPTRHYKKRGMKRDTCSIDELPAVVLKEEAIRADLPEPISIKSLHRCELWIHGEMKNVAGRSLRWLEFRRERVFGNGRHGTHTGGGFEIEFPAPVGGPVALGYGCHFGLGLFAPAG